MPGQWPECGNEVPKRGVGQVGRNAVVITSCDSDNYQWFPIVRVFEPGVIGGEEFPFAPQLGA